MRAVVLEAFRQSVRGQTRVLPTSDEPTERPSVEQGGLVQQVLEALKTKRKELFVGTVGKWATHTIGVRTIMH